MEAVQLNILEANEERNKGIEQAISHAEEVSPGWKDRAFELLKEFIKSNPGEFMVEELRSYAAVVDFETPTSNRAWGAVIKRAEKKGLVRYKGFGITKNPKSHRTPAAVWEPI